MIVANIYSQQFVILAEFDEKNMKIIIIYV